MSYIYLYTQRYHRYHGWMKSPELQQLTASEPLSLEEEYEMQSSWLMDEDKCTFIILEKSAFENTGDEIGAMIGDTNLFFFQSEDCMKLAEAEIMIAENSARRKRRGWEAMLLMLRYGCEELAIEKFQAKISCVNEKSILMFQKMGFVKISESAVFKEVTLEKCVNETWRHWLMAETQGSQYIQTGEEEDIKSENQLHQFPQSKCMPKK
ncbi:N-acetyltransferase 9-like protein isoform X3 [Cryptotermes secundus]|uniref:N-acetyltransferase 9-like protein isoform X3 n=1 Tax=Cryptotermes secundus TaxID=105785 RepID=UPI001454C372|nr:N-acetyltransferase 9-like protein isoform X3 [Cryptotermes secundus]